MNLSQYSTISFPSFGIEINPPQVLSLGPVDIHLYGLVIALGLMLAAVYGMRRSKEFGLTEDNILDGVLWITPFAIVCARAYYVAFTWEHYSRNPISVLYIWEGGLAIYGGVLGAILGMWVFCRVKKLKFAAVLDLVLLGFLIGQSMGRWGNFFNREAFGAPTDSFFRMGLYNTTTGAWEYYHPTFLYESVWNLIGLVLLYAVVRPRRKFDGQLFASYILWYGLGRAWIEGMRTDSLYLFGTGIRVSQALAILSAAIALGAILFLLRRQKRRPVPLYAERMAERERASEATPDAERIPDEEQRQASAPAEISKSDREKE